MDLWCDRDEVTPPWSVEEDSVWNHYFVVLGALVTEDFLVPFQIRGSALDY